MGTTSKRSRIRWKYKGHSEEQNDEGTFEGARRLGARMAGLHRRISGERLRFGMSVSAIHLRLDKSMLTCSQVVSLAPSPRSCRFQIRQTHELPPTPSNENSPLTVRRGTHKQRRQRSAVADPCRILSEPCAFVGRTGTAGIRWDFDSGERAMGSDRHDLAGDSGALQA